MADITWIKLYTGILHNRKIEYLRSFDDGNQVFSLWIIMLILAGESNSDGKLMLTDSVPYDSFSLSRVAHMSEESVKDALDSFEYLGMISTKNREGFIKITGWEDHQNVDAFEEMKKEQKKQNNCDRQKRFRENHKEQPDELSVVTCNTTEALRNADRNANSNAPVTQHNVTHNADSNATVTLRNAPKSVTEPLRNADRNAPKALRNADVTQCNATDKDKDIDIEREKEQEREQQQLQLLHDQLQIDHDDVELHQIRDDHDAIFNLWKKCGFTLSDRVMDQLVELYSEHGLAKVMESIKITADANPKAPMQYLPKVLADYGKPKPAPVQQVKVTQQKVLPAQNYTQRAYSDADEIDYADRIMFGEVKV